LLAYNYYQKLLEKIRRAEPDALLEKRFRIPNTRKFMLLIRCNLQNAFNIL